MTEQRIINIEMKLAYLEDTIAQLNDVIYKQQNQIDFLERLNKQLIKKLSDLSEGANQPGGIISALDERPPHY